MFPKGRVYQWRWKEMAEDPESLIHATLEVNKSAHNVKLTPTHLFWDDANVSHSSGRGAAEPLFRK